METFSSIGMILASVITLLCLVLSKMIMTELPPSVPWVGLRKEVLSKTRANIRELVSGSRTLKIGYNQVSEKLPVTLALLMASVRSFVERVYLM